MDKVWIVWVRDWKDGWVAYSFHRTEKGALDNIEKANTFYVTSSSYVNSYDVED